MASDNKQIGAKIALDGEKEFKSAISGINKDMSVLASELKKVSSSFVDNKDSIEALTAKNDVLNKQVDTQKDKINTLKQALENAKKEYGENSDKAKDWQIKLNNAETQLNKLNDQVVSNKKAMDEAKESVDNNAESLEDFGKEADNSKASVLSLSDIIKANLISNAIMSGVKTLADSMKSLGKNTVGFVLDSSTAFNDLATKTGATEEEFSSLKATMNDIYNDNFGDSIQDVADTMAEVKQQTKLSGDELKNTTERALLMRDTFDMDVNESIRSANMLMEQFGLSSDEAYNLIAQGAQNGLNKNGDLLDTINEYSVQFEGLGLSADDMFNMLVNGAESGTFSVDKLGDTVKEFGIRVKDNSDSTLKAFADIGLNANEVTKKFGEGGESAKKAMADTVKAIFTLDDPIARNAAGVALFGTMWEDLGEKGIKSLTNLDGSISKSSDSLKKINDQKYNDIGSAMEGLGRQIQTSIAEPLGQQLMPVVQDIIAKVQENAPEITETVSSIAKGVGELVSWMVDNSSIVLTTISGIGIGMLTWNVASMINGVVTAITGMKGAQDAAAVSQQGLNLAMNANPIMLIVTLIATLVGGIVAFVATNEDARKKIGEAWTVLKETVGKAVETISGFFTKTLPESINKLTDKVKELPGNVKKEFDSIISNVKAWASDFKDKAVDGASKMASGVVNGITSLPSNIKGKLDNIISDVTSWAGDLKTKASSAAKNMSSAVVDGVTSLPGKIGDMGTKTIKSLWNGINDFSSTLKKNVKDLGGDVVDYIEKGFTGVGTIGKNLVEGLWNGISNMAGWIKSKIQGFGKGVLDDLKSFFGIHSPSRKMRDEVGTYLAQGIGVGFTEEMSNITKDMNASIPTDFAMDGSYNITTDMINTSSASDSTPSSLIDYDKLGDVLVSKLSGMKVILDKEPVGEFVKDTFTREVFV